MDAVQICNLSFRYSNDSDLIFSNFELNIPQRTITVITGDNGTGKSTLLYLICGIIPRAIHGIVQGTILLNGTDYSEKPLPHFAPIASILMQEIEWQLHFPSVEQEIIFGPENLCLPVPEIGKRLHEALELFGIESLRHLDTHTLSYGQKKLVAMAALYALRPSILILDEPLNGLSDESAARAVEFIRLYKQQHGAVIMSAHQPEASLLADQSVDLNQYRSER